MVDPMGKQKKGVFDPQEGQRTTVYPMGKQKKGVFDPQEGQRTTVYPMGKQKERVFDPQEGQRTTADPMGLGINHRVVTPSRSGINFKTILRLILARFIRFFLKCYPNGAEQVFDGILFMNNVWSVFVFVCMLWGKLFVKGVVVWCFVGNKRSKENKVARRVRVFLSERGDFGLYSRLVYGNHAWLRVYDEMFVLANKVRRLILGGCVCILLTGIYFNSLECTLLVIPGHRNNI